MSARPDFWSRRKAGVAAEAAEEEAAATAEPSAEAQFPGKSDEEILEELGLPDPESLGEGDDFSVFMAKIVPDRIRQRALRKLWTSNPVLANVDKLVDYGEDFTDSATVIENLQTAYQVGKGMLRHVEEMARQAEDLARAPDEVEEISEDEAPVDVAAQQETKPEVDVASVDGEDEQETEQVVKPRRMQFSFGDMSS